jgi:hypothetical protein
MSKQQNSPTTNVTRTSEQQEQEQVRTTQSKAKKRRLEQLEERIAPACA